jgi:hypothetical protein
MFVRKKHDEVDLEVRERHCFLFLPHVVAVGDL